MSEIQDFSPVEQMEVTLFWEGVLGAAQFSRVQELLQRDAEAGLVVYSRSSHASRGDGGEMNAGNVNASSLADRVEARLRKGVHYPPLRLEVSNQYEYLTEGKEEYAAQRAGLRMEIQHRMTDVAVTCSVDERTLKFWHAYALQLLERLAAEKGGPAKASKQAAGNLKQLKQRDPELYTPKTKDHVVYSRVCQKSHQPVPYTEDELRALPAEDRARSVKYWNFTTQQPLWYLCPSDRYPHLGFITGRHPAGYCYPCCKKTPAHEDEVLRSCLTEHVFTEPPSTTHERYIYNYGKTLAEGRLGNLPSELGRYLQYITMTDEPESRRRGRPTAQTPGGEGQGARWGYFLLGVPQEGLGALAALAAGAGRTPEALLEELGPGWEARLGTRALLGCDALGLERLAAQLVAAMPKLGFQVVEILYAGGRYELRRTGVGRLPSIVLFRRIAEEDNFGNNFEWYPVVEVDELAFFRDHEVRRRHFGAETELARLLRDLGRDELEGCEVLGAAAFEGAPFAAIVRLKKGGLTAIPSSPQRLAGQPILPYPRLAEITATAEEVAPVAAALGGARAGLVLNGSVVGVRTDRGHVWHRALEPKKAAWGPLEDLPYSPDAIYSRNAPARDAKQNGKRASRHDEMQPKSQTLAVREQYYEAMRRVMEHLDAERNAAFRRKLEGMVTAAGTVLDSAGTGASSMEGESEADRQAVRHILALGLSADETLFRLRQRVYEADRRELNAILDAQPREAKHLLKALLRRVGVRLPSPLLDIMALEFTDPSKRTYLRAGYYPLRENPPWENVYVHG
jgi:hypothetical protein